MFEIDEIKNRKEKKLAGSLKKLIKQKKKTARFVGAKMQINNQKRGNDYQ